MLNWTKDDTNIWEVVQNRVSRIGLGANRMVVTEAIRGTWEGAFLKREFSQGLVNIK